MKAADLLTQVIANTEVLKGKDARDAFVRSRPGVRRDVPETATVVALPVALNSEQDQAYQRRRSSRQFAPQPLPADQLYTLLSGLRGREQGDTVKYRYPSAGSSYAVQTYLHVKAGGCAGLAAGTYYYHPLRHELLRLGDEPPDLAELHVPGNRPIFAGAAFSLFLIADLRGIRPLYGDAGLDLTRLEAGHIAQLLMEEAAAADIDLCPIGYLRFDPVRSCFGLNDPAQVLLYSLLGGGRRAAASVVEQTPSPPTPLLPRERGAMVSLENTVAAIWARVLQLKVVELDAQFFEIGGNSFAVLDVQREIAAELGIECPVAQLFRYPTVRTLAAWLATLQPSPPGPDAAQVPAEIQEPVATAEISSPASTANRRDRRRAIRQQLHTASHRHDQPL